MSIIPTKEQNEMQSIFDELQNTIKQLKKENKKLKRIDIKNEIKSGMLLDFLIWLNDNKMIDNHSFEYEKAIKKFITQQKISINANNKDNY